MTTSAAGKKRSALRVFQHIRDRKHSYSFRMVQARLGLAGIPSATGWDALLEKYRAMGNDADWDTYLRVAQEVRLASIRYGNAAVSIHSIEETAAEMLIQRSDELLDTSNDFTGSYPRMLSSDDLRVARNSTGFMRRRVLDGGGVELTWCGRRYYKERQELNQNQLSPEVRSALGSFDTLIGVRAFVVQYFDRVVVRPEGYVEVYVDQCCPSPLPADDIETARRAHVTFINRHFAAYLDDTPIIPETDNLQPLVEQFYDERDGAVVTLGHSTSTNSIKDERMRGRRRDLREEPFHRNGRDAVAYTDLFAIKKAWSGDGWTGAPTITLPGHFTAPDRPTPRIEYAIVEGCATRADMEFAVAKLRQS